MNTAVDGSVFCGQAKSIETHGVKHIIAVHNQIAAGGVADEPIAAVAHVHFSGWIWEHVKVIELFSGAL